MKPKGKIIIIGGAEDKEDQRNEMRDKNQDFKQFEILKEVRKASKDEAIEIITSGSKIPDEIEEVNYAIKQVLSQAFIFYFPDQVALAIQHLKNLTSQFNKNQKRRIQ